MILLALGCSGSLSNAIFIEDADFLAALPVGEDLAVTYPGEPSVETDDAAYFRTTLQTLEGFQQWSVLITNVSDTIRAVPPSERGDDYRIWGPGAWDAYPGSFLRLEMSRTSDGGLYIWTFQASPMSEGPWTEFMTGSTWTEGEWDTELLWDQGELSEAVGAEGQGTIELAYARDEEATTLSVEARGLVTSSAAPATTTRMWIEALPSGSGEFQLAQRMDVNPGELVAIEEHVELVSRWDDAGLGRADGLVEGGDYPYPGLVLTQCWAEDGTLTYLSDSEGVLPVEGEAAAGPF